MRIFAADQETISVHVRIEGFSDDNGLSRLLIYGQKKGFPDSTADALLAYTNPIKNKTADFYLKLVSGRYAFSVLHDRNVNGKMDKTWYGKPVEGFGASNNPPSETGPPAFDECVLEIGNNFNTLLIRIHYL
ncbi:MAG: DUF2141 domain-containing protein [Candidatus Aureabacteria bacterium]|nr:DUF2141 domain-containing protein [Candidatus Auribacterota bacterium]